MYNVAESILFFISLQEQPSYDYAILYIDPLPWSQAFHLHFLPPVHTHIFLC